MTFRPTRNAIYRGTLVVTATWADGQVETQSMDLRGRGRELDQAPSHERSPDEVAAAQAEDARLAQEHADEQARIAANDKIDEPYPQHQADAFEAAARAAGGAGRRLAAGQLLGAKTAGDEAAAYHRTVQPPARSLWWDLLEIAISVGTAGVAGAVAKNFVNWTEAYLDAKGAPGIAAIGDMIKEGIKTGSKRAMAMTGGGGGGDATEHVESGRRDHSTNQRIDFFAEQVAILDAATAEREQLIEDRRAALKPLLRTEHAATAVAAMSAVGDAFAAAATDAEQAQHDATAVQWVSYVARASFGVEDVPRQNIIENGEEPAPQTATKLDTVRPEDPASLMSSPRGLLDIGVWVGIGDQGARWAKPTYASLEGVSQEIADRIARIPLRDVPVPLRLVLGPNN